MPKQFLPKHQYIHLDSIDSTSRFLKDLAEKERPLQPVICTTREQTQGYGQQGKTWLSEADSSIFSILLPLKSKAIVPGSASLKTALAIHKQLSKEINEPLTLKWPNDIYNTKGKVAGSLLELVALPHYRALVIGVGINHSPPKNMQTASYIASFDLKPFLEGLLTNLSVDNLLSHEKADDLWLSDWQAVDFFHINEPLQLIQQGENSALPVTYLGINAQGQALVQGEEKVYKLTSGANSLRKR